MRDRAGIVVAPESAAHCRGVPISCAHPGAIAGLEQAHECAPSFRGDAIAVIDEVLTEHPDFIMAHLFRAAWLTQAMETRIYEKMVVSVQRAAVLEARADSLRTH